MTASASVAEATAAPRRGLVLGCGGTLGAAWTIGMLAAVEQQLEWDVTTATVIVGTSAGAELALPLGSGVGVQALVDAARGLPGADPVLAQHFASPPRGLPPRPRLRFTAPALARLGLRRRIPVAAAASGLLPEGRDDAAWLAALADRFVPSGGWVSHPATWMVTVDAATGERVAFGGPDAPTAAARDAVRASWAVPGWFPPVPIAAGRYVDGGVRSPASADLTLPLGLDEVVVIAPMASRASGRPGSPAAAIEFLLRRTMSRTLAVECAALEAAGTRVMRIDPGEQDLRVMGANFMDRRRRSRVLEHALRTGPRTVAAALQRAGCPAAAGSALRPGLTSSTNKLV